MLLTFKGYEPIDSKNIEFVAIPSEADAKGRFMITLTEPVYDRKRGVSRMILYFRPNGKMSFLAWKRYFLNLSHIDVSYFGYDRVTKTSKRMDRLKLNRYFTTQAIPPAPWEKQSKEWSDGPCGE